MAIKQTSSCADSSSKSSLESPGGPLLDTTSNVVTRETGDGVPPVPTDDGKPVTLKADGGVVLNYMPEMPDIPRFVNNTGMTPS